eukprot:CAMPEP_0171100706 /NCGR_PEP_ID=MMETSP0766_2-20121228/53116_1 /TAXON_ID=439317 /ORGANISM="Gambierdiscus australes, Strain CAWD 149" /LENGTH=107 /DNA_ID=CAMNT_0011560577 /DNA_START=240 /DNA_END=564 /DNA_ORIENTATION=-
MRQEGRIAEEFRLDVPALHVPLWLPINDNDDDGKDRVVHRPQILVRPEHGVEHVANAKDRRDKEPKRNAEAPKPDTPIALLHICPDLKESCSRTLCTERLGQKLSAS